MLHTFIHTHGLPTFTIHYVLTFCCYTLPLVVVTVLPRLPRGFTLLFVTLLRLPHAAVRHYARHTCPVRCRCCPTPYATVFVVPHYRFAFYLYSLCVYRFCRVSSVHRYVYYLVGYGSHAVRFFYARHISTLVVQLRLRTHYAAVTPRFARLPAVALHTTTLLPFGLHLGSFALYLLYPYADSLRTLPVACLARSPRLPVTHTYTASHTGLRLPHTAHTHTCACQLPPAVRFWLQLPTYTAATLPYRTVAVTFVTRLHGLVTRTPRTVTVTRLRILVATRTVLPTHLLPGLPPYGCVYCYLALVAFTRTCYRFGFWFVLRWVGFCGYTHTVTVHGLVYCRLRLHYLARLPTVGCWLRFYHTRVYGLPHTFAVWFVRYALHAHTHTARVGSATRCGYCGLLRLRLWLVLDCLHGCWLRLFWFALHIPCGYAVTRITFYLLRLPHTVTFTCLRLVTHAVSFTQFCHAYIRYFASLRLIAFTHYALPHRTFRFVWV